MNVGTLIAPRSTGSPHCSVPRGSRSLFSRYVLRRYQQNIGPGRLVASLFQ